MIIETPRPEPLATLAIGSAPFVTASEAIDLMAGNLDIPAHPQLVRITPWEDMLLSAVSGLPAFKVGDTGDITVAIDGREPAMAEFYERWYSGDLSFLALDSRSSLGFESLISRAAEDPAFGPRFLKSQVVGPLTLGQSVKVEGANALVDDPGLLEICSLAMGGKAAIAAARIRELGRTPVIFFDEPGLTGYGSAFSTLTPETVTGALTEAVTAAKAGGPALIGCHVCGNTDWGLLTKVGLDIINFDAFEYLDTICLYPKEIKGFLEAGGSLAWGVVPTRDFDESIKALALADLVLDGWRRLAGKGIDAELLKERTLITSACGLGGLTPGQAKGIIGIMPEVAGILKGEKV
jgi:hypothetical protein